MTLNLMERHWADHHIYILVVQDGVLVGLSLTEPNRAITSAEVQAGPFLRFWHGTPPANDDDPPRTGDDITYAL